MWAMLTGWSGIVNMALRTASWRRASHCGSPGVGAACWAPRSWRLNVRVFGDRELTAVRLRLEVITGLTEVFTIPGCSDVVLVSVTDAGAVVAWPGGGGCDAKGAEGAADVAVSNSGSLVVSPMGAVDGCHDCWDGGVHSHEGEGPGEWPNAAECNLWGSD